MTDQSAVGYDEQKRKRLIEAAAGAFGRFGFDRVPVEEIANAADVGKGTVYLYFDRKEELFLSALWELKRRLEEAITETCSGPGNEVRGFIRAHLQLADEAPDLFRCFTSALFGVNRDFQTSALEIFGWQQDCLRELIRVALPRSVAVRSERDFALMVGCINATSLLRTLVASAPSLDGDERLLMMLLEDR